MRGQRWQDCDNSPAARVRPPFHRHLGGIVLDVLGLDDSEELAYRALVEVPSYDASELADRLSCHPVEAARALTALETLGLAARSSSATDRYVASPPSVALAALAVQREEELRRAQREIESLAEVYRGTDTERSVSDVVDVVRGQGGRAPVRPTADVRGDVVIEGSSDGLAELDARILGLPLAGLTDQAVANQLNLSMRTVQRRVRALMDLVSADTRLQLGFHAARTGWI